jgi:hypothetical protein
MREGFIVLFATVVLFAFSHGIQAQTSPRQAGAQGVPDLSGTWEGPFPPCRTSAGNRIAARYSS